MQKPAILSLMSEEKAKVQDSARLYEAAYLVSPRVPEEQVASVILSVKNFLASKNAIISGESAPSFRRLAYQIAPFDSAFFGWFRFETDSETASAVKNLFSETKDIVRFLLIKADISEPVRAFTRRPSKRVEHGIEHVQFETRIPVNTEEKPKGEVSEEELNKKIEELVRA